MLARLVQRGLDAQVIAGSLEGSRTFLGVARDFIESNGNVAKIYDKLQLFDVFSSVWFQATFILLAISLVGCILPRSWDHYKAWKTPPTRAPKYLHKLPLAAEGHSDKSEDELSAEIKKRLKKWRVAEYSPEKDRAGVHAFSAERGYGRELANLIFHVALVAIILVAYVGMQFGLFSV